MPGVHLLSNHLLQLFTLPGDGGSKTMASSDGAESWLLSFQFKMEKENITKGRRHMNVDLLGDLGLNVPGVSYVLVSHQLIQGFLPEIVP